MRRALSRRLEGAGREDGITLIELLVGAAMGVTLMAATASLMISAVKSQPQISEKAQTISTARWVMERFTREIRNGIEVNPEKKTASEVSFTAYVRTPTCGGSGTLPATSNAKVCEVTYKCAPPACWRTETDPGGSGTATKIFSGIDNANVFSYTPTEGPARYIEVTLRFPNPSGTGNLTISDGASLRNANLAY
jgi:type II secretory pathway pseudopilin PulG